jgi:predicted transcriptional regulator
MRSWRPAFAAIRASIQVTRYTNAADRAGLADSAIGKLTGTKWQQKVADHPK